MWAKAKLKLKLSLRVFIYKSIHSNLQPDFDSQIGYFITGFEELGQAFIDQYL